MNVQLLIAAILVLVGAAIHTFAGEKTDIKHLKRSQIPAGLKLEIRMSWYMAAIDMAVSGIYMLFLAFNDSLEGARLLVSFTALRITLYGVVAFLLLLITQRDYLFRVPQWVLLIAIGLMAWWGIA
jgi:hypothetical protein